MKLNDAVSWNGKKLSENIVFTETMYNFLCTHTRYVISYIDDSDNTCKLVGSPDWFDLGWLTLVSEERVNKNNIINNFIKGYINFDEVVQKAGGIYPLERLNEVTAAELLEALATNHIEFVYKGEEA